LRPAPASRSRGTYPHLSRRLLRHTDIGNPQPIRSVEGHVFRATGIDRLVVIAVGGRGIAAAASRRQTVLAHQASDLLAIDDHPMPQLGANPPAVAFKLVADRGDGLDDCCVDAAAATPEHCRCHARQQECTHRLELAHQRQRL
jgi:hypothetical protein